ncbi:MAG: hypothetical protein DHS20C21_03470 [Gemmatimonadota bacterium]|nr:MAG: hypothetical protein DHS20C21_03470 [Gemmatimonadota bacterium]
MEVGIGLRAWRTTSSASSPSAVLAAETHAVRHDMFRTKTCIVLGAGASKPLGFPVGSELLYQLIDDLGSPVGTVRQLALDAGFGEGIVDFLAVLRESPLPSVDLLLEKRPAFVDIGKFCIAAAITQFEEGAPFIAGSNRTDWLRYLFTEMDSGASLDSFLDNQVSFVTYNYDRSLEHFFSVALGATYGLPRAECANVVREIPICHVHGQLGHYPGLGEWSRPYSPTQEQSHIKECASQIRILHEGSKDDEAVTMARALCESAEVVGLIGFGYHPTNVARLEPAAWHANSRTFGSAFGMTPAETRRIGGRFGREIDFTDSTDDALGFLRRSEFLRWCA